MGHMFLTSFVQLVCNAHLNIEPRPERRHVILLWLEGGRLRLHPDRVYQEVRQQELRHHGAGGYSRPVRPEQISDGVDDISIFAPGDV